jgi:hypothetical protein
LAGEASGASLPEESEGAKLRRTGASAASIGIGKRCQLVAAKVHEESLKKARSLSKKEPMQAELEQIIAREKHPGIW